ncbi:MAG TPA: hypothetical protein VK348_01805 [Planctomycetota bacterium]|nr:hypothetical protein [Planctomycetota bacterium]
MVTLMLWSMVMALAPQDPPSPAVLAADAPFVDILDLPAPKGVVLEVGGILCRGQELLVCTRRGEIWRVQDAYGKAPKFSLWCEGLQEPLGLLEHDGWIYVSQRGELSRMRDRDGDGRMDELETVSQGWPLSGNYHEYCFGPALDADGSLWLTLNKPFGDEPFGHADWRGWAVRIGKDGKWQPVCAGLRSPAGVATAPWGEVFYTDNQGEWCPTCKLSPLHAGDFHGHPHGIDSCKLPASKVAWPGPVPDGRRIDEVAREIANFRLPAVWIPYDRLGRSASGFVWDADGQFPPYRGQVFCGDQYSSEVFRMSLEQQGGRWQGACYPFRRGLKCGLTRLAWGTDGSLWCGMTNRGWPSAGSEQWGLQRLVWRGQQPFDLVEVTARHDGFQLRFSLPVDPASVVPSAFQLQNWTYDLHSDYGCAELDRRALQVTAATVTQDGLAVELVVEGLLATRVHMIECAGVRSRTGGAPWHDVAWYTLNVLP